MTFWGYFWLSSLVGLAVFLAVFLILRWFWLWYWRVDAIHSRLEEIRDELRLMSGAPRHQEQQEQQGRVLR